MANELGELSIVGKKNKGKQKALTKEEEEQKKKEEEQKKKEEEQKKKKEEEQIKLENEKLQEKKHKVARLKKEEELAKGGHAKVELSDKRLNQETGDTEFRKYTARTRQELDKLGIQEKEWTHDEMEHNAREKLKHIKNHMAGDDTSEWHKLEMESQRMCNIENVKSAASYVFDGGMPLENDADSVVLPSDDQKPADESPAGKSLADEGPAGEGPTNEDSAGEGSAGEYSAGEYSEDSSEQDDPNDLTYHP
ncbi:unnamed protein product [Clonostachys byssicola]|uniref:Uncharacterized protein n=1 Tax=Clonostachys byssicola TaxID=160290 RepID=A0A9N9UP59_9HYPO|nr:unnamed protein product [Clonostachys byssicola]